jgi:glycosyltransferase involved in cell wall biosynthesis
MNEPEEICGMRVLVIGPIYPYRGGIAHSTRLLCECLGERNEVTAISFSRMYPERLYPGKSQKEIGVDPDFRVKTEYILDSMNPLTWIRLARRIRRERPDRVIFKWWHTFFTPMFWTIARLGRNGSTLFAAICHNVLPHDEMRVHSFLARTFFRTLDYFVTLSKSDLGILRSLMPGKPATWITESTYETLLGDVPSRKEAWEALGLSSSAILFFGFVRPYKGLKFLLEALPLVLRKKPDVTLLVVGEFWNDKCDYQRQIEALGIGSWVTIVDRYVSNEDIPMYFSAADAVVLPYLSSTESGIIQLAYGLNTPIITTAVGGNVDLIENGKTGMLCRPEDPEDLARAILEFYEKDLDAPIKAAMRENADLFRWTERKENAVLNIHGQVRGEP